MKTDLNGRSLDWNYHMVLQLPFRDVVFHLYQEQNSLSENRVGGRRVTVFRRVNRVFFIFRKQLFKMKIRNICLINASYTR